jgi:hypothetical protein
MLIAIQCLQSASILSAIITVDFMITLTTYHSNLSRKLHYEEEFSKQKLYSILNIFNDIHG